MTYSILSADSSPNPVPSPIPPGSPGYVDHVAIALSRLPMQFRS